MIGQIRRLILLNAIYYFTQQVSAGEVQRSENVQSDDWRDERRVTLSLKGIRWILLGKQRVSRGGHSTKNDLALIYLG